MTVTHPIVTITMSLEYEPVKNIKYKSNTRMCKIETNIIIIIL